MSDIRSTLEALCEAFNAHDLDAIMALFADDCVLEMPRGPDPSRGARSEGKTAVREALASRFQGLPDVHYGDATHFFDADTGISKWTLTGTTPEGRRLGVRGCGFDTFRDGLVVRKEPIGRSSRRRCADISPIPSPSLSLLSPPPSPSSRALPRALRPPIASDL